MCSAISCSTFSYSGFVRVCGSASLSLKAFFLREEQVHEHQRVVVVQFGGAVQLERVSLVHVEHAGQFGAEDVVVFDDGVGLDDSRFEQLILEVFGIVRLDLFFLVLFDLLRSEVPILGPLLFVRGVVPGFPFSHRQLDDEASVQAAPHDRPCQLRHALPIIFKNI